MKKALERSARHAGGGLSLGAFARPGPLRDLKRRRDERSVIFHATRAPLIEIGPYTGPIAVGSARTE